MKVTCLFLFLSCAACCGYAQSAAAIGHEPATPALPKSAATGHTPGRDTNVAAAAARDAGAGTKTKISPNPNHGTFVLSGKEYVSNDEISVQVLNAMGQVVFQSQIWANRFGEINDQVHLPPANEKGTYTLQLRAKRKSISLQINVE